MLFGLVRSSSASLRGSTIIPTTTTTDPATSHVCISCILYASNDYFSPSLLVVREKMRSIFGMVYVYPLLHSYCWHPWLRGGSTGSWNGCNLKTGQCCMIAFLSCLNFALPILRPVLRLYAYLYLRLYLRGTVHCLLAYCLVDPKNWSPWWKLGGTAVKKPQVWSPLGLYRHVIISFMTFWPCRTSSVPDCNCICTISEWGHKPDMAILASLPPIPTPSLGLSLFASFKNFLPITPNFSCTILRSVSSFFALWCSIMYILMWQELSLVKLTKISRLTMRIK